MTPEQIRVAAETLADAMAETVMRRAKDLIGVQMGEVFPGRPLTDHETLVLEIGISAGHVQTLLALQDIGVLPK